MSPFMYWSTLFRSVDQYMTQNGFHGIFVDFPQHQKVYLVYVLSTRKLISSYDIVFEERFSSALSYTSRPYAEAMAMRPEVTYTPYATSLKEQTGDVVTFAHFEEGDLLTETRNDAESCDESNRKSLMMNKQDMENLDSNKNSDDYHISTETLHDICGGIQTHPNVDKLETRRKIRDRVRRK